MRFLLIFFLLSVAAASPNAVSAAPQQVGPLWTKGDWVVAVAPCTHILDHSEYCRGIQVRRGAIVEELGEGYSAVKLLWTRRPGAEGPDLLVRGDWGGSGGLADLFAISLEPRLTVRKLSMEHADWVTADGAGRVLRFDAPFTIPYFNGAPNSNTTTNHLPMRWLGGDFAVDLGTLTGRSYSQGELRFRELAIRHELSRWASDAYPSARLFPPEARAGTPVTVHALTDLMLAGRADLAKELLDRTWPRSPSEGGLPMGGKERFWNALCRAFIENRAYKMFGLSRLPNSALIEASAAVARQEG